jgi:hypothetical protein
LRASFSLSTQALVHLGEIPIRSTAPPTCLEGARQIIDILTVLSEKTRGNLDPAESALLESAYDLRMRYVTARGTDSACSSTKPTVSKRRRRIICIRIAPASAATRAAYRPGRCGHAAHGPLPPCRQARAIRFWGEEDKPGEEQQHVPRRRVRRSRHVAGLPNFADLAEALRPAW